MFTRILWRGRAVRGHLRSLTGTAGGCDSAAQQGSADAGLHIPSVNATIPPHRQDCATCYSEGMWGNFGYGCFPVAIEEPRGDSLS